MRQRVLSSLALSPSLWLRARSGFGVVYEGTDLNNGKKVAIKLEEREAKKPSKLEKEYDFYQRLRGGGERAARCGVQ